MDNYGASNRCGGSGGGLQQSQQVTAAPIKLPILEGHAVKVFEQCEQLEQIAGRLHEIADRVFGQRPPPQGAAEGAVNKLVSSHSLSRLEQAQLRLDSARVNLRHGVERLEAL
jgi:hypothetical protein